LNPEPLSLQSLFVDASKHIQNARRFKNFDEMTAVMLQRRLETVVHGNKPMLGAARQAFGSSVRAYATHSVDTKGIFRVQTLHLGHMARSFALRESPKTLRVRDDVISRIFNGAFSRSVVVDKEAKQRARDEKYSLSKGGGNSRGNDRDRDRGTGTGTGNGRDRDRGNKGASNGTRRDSKGTGAGAGSESRPARPAASKPTSENDGEGESAATDPSPSTASEARAGPAAGPSRGNNKQPYSSLTGKTVPLRMTSTSSSSSVAASGKFRKSGGYFKKKLRAQATSEFSS
jgi:hypothetical protein